jgi:hypothetical protein
MKKIILNMLFLLLCKCSFSQNNDNPYFDYAIIEYVSIRRERVEGAMHLTFDKKYAIVEDDENYNYLIYKNTFVQLANFIIKNRNCFTDEKIAVKKGASFKVTLYKDSMAFIEYFVFEKMGYDYFQKLSIELKSTDVYLASVFASLINSGVFYYYSK